MNDAAPWQLVIDDLRESIGVMREDLDAIDGSVNDNSALRRLERSVVSLDTRLAAVEQRLRAIEVRYDPDG
jgi:hypothetical protein